MKWFAKAQRQQTAVNEKYAASLRAGKAAREAEAAVRGRGGRKGKEKETQASRKARGKVAAATRSTRTRARRVYCAVSFITKEEEEEEDLAVMLELLNSFNKKMGYSYDFSR